MINSSRNINILYFFCIGHSLSRHRLKRLDVNSQRKLPKYKLISVEFSSFLGCFGVAGFARGANFMVFCYILFSLDEQTPNFRDYGHNDHVFNIKTLKKVGRFGSIWKEEQKILQ